MNAKARLCIVSAFLASIALVALLRPARMSPQAAVDAAQPLTTSQAGDATPTMAGYLPIILNDESRSPSPSPQMTATPGGQVPAFSHVFIIVMENEAYEQIIGNSSAPYLNSLAQRYAVATNYYGVGHPSLQNYIALVGGDTFGISTDCTDCFVNAPNLVDQLEAAGKSWKAYMEDMPSPCFLGDWGTLYRQKHNPFIYFDDIRQDAARCNKIVPFSQFDADLRAGALPDYVWITPNMCHDIHDCALKDGDAWLQTWVAKILASPAWQQGGVLFITWDEAPLRDSSGCCQYAAGGHILTLVLSPLGRAAYRSPVAYDHYSLLRTIEESWKLPPLAKAACACSAPMADVFTPMTTGQRP